MQWQCKTYEQLTKEELYEILQLRVKVFVVEQRGLYLDLDGKDQHSLHLFATTGEKIVAYCRILPRGMSFEEVAIGRVIVGEESRGKGLGLELMERAIQAAFDEWGEEEIRISAQAHLQKFYGELGFVTASEVYVEDGDTIPHVDMLKSSDNK